MVDLVGHAFETISQSNHFPERYSTRGQREVLVCRRNLEQVHICIGTPGLSYTDERRFALSLLNTILGGNMSSRLFQEIREKRGLAYSVYSFTASHVDAGMFGAYAAVEPGNEMETLELILSQMRHMKKTSVGEDVLQDAKEYTKGNLMLSAESVDNQMARLAQNEVHFGRYISLDEVVDAVEKVTVSDIRVLSESLFRKTPLALSLLGAGERRGFFWGQVGALTKEMPWIIW